MDSIQKGQHAKRLLEDAVLLEAFDEARALFIESWIDGETVVARENAWAKIHALAEVRRVLEGLMGDAIFETAMADRQES